MNFIKVTWVDKSDPLFNPDTAPEFEAENLNRIEQGIEDLNAYKVEKETGKGLSANDFTTIQKNKLDAIEENATNYQHPALHALAEIDGLVAELAGKESADATIIKEASIVDDLLSIDTTKPLSANQGKVLKGFIDSLNTLLTSDDTTLDELQEIVTFIKQNKTDLDALGISNIAGLVDALALKSDATHNHDLAYEAIDETLLRRVVPVSETASPTYAPDLLDDSFFEYILNQNSVIENPLNMIQGRAGKIVVKQDAIGGRTATFGTYYNFPAGLPTLNSDADAYSVFNYTVFSDKCILMEYVSDFVAIADVYDQTIVYDNTNIGTEFIA